MKGREGKGEGRVIERGEKGGKKIDGGENLVPVVLGTVCCLF
jgi:hypothetical protein